MNIPLEEEINKEEKASNDFKEEDLGIQASKEECYNCNQFEHYSTECRKKAPIELSEQVNYADEDAIISGYQTQHDEYRKTSRERVYSLHEGLSCCSQRQQWRLIAFVKMSKNRMFPLKIQYDAAKCLTANTNSEE
ncbi:hypothetical protein DKX38_023851 [Salix brachista]|uniref:CCHC-type domain-containing protein n=1 Tax=Salix brachista TaxID=2182728 RepID=A0A5N5JKW9_9ROSI|nr:hypothetical protein DKX38_023851 [Salix brachista]